MFEIKKREINTMLIQNFEKVESMKANIIFDRTWCQRLFKRAPEQFDVYGSDSQSPFMLIRDPNPANPNFVNFLYMSLDYQLVILYILWFYFFDYVTGNSVLSLFFVYLIEKFLITLRKVLGKRNLVKKSMFDERFIM